MDLQDNSTQEITWYINSAFADLQFLTTPCAGYCHGFSTRYSCLGVRAVAERAERTDHAGASLQPTTPEGRSAGAALAQTPCLLCQRMLLGQGTTSETLEVLNIKSFKKKNKKCSIILSLGAGGEVLFNESQLAAAVVGFTLQTRHHRREQAPQGPRVGSLRVLWNGLAATASKELD